MVGVPALEKCDLRAIVTDRLALFLLAPQKIDKWLAEEEAEEERREERRPRPEGDVAEKVEDVATFGKTR